MKDEDKTFENENKITISPHYLEEKESGDWDVVINDYKKQLYAIQKYKSEAIMLDNQLKGTKAIIGDFAKAN